MKPLWSADPVLIPVQGTDDGFPVRRIYCVGRNYVDHIIEMKEGDERDEPFFFAKPTDAIVPTGSTVPYPSGTADLQFEGELVVAIGAPIPLSASPVDAMASVFGYAAGIDLTRRDRQRESLARSRPWEPGKSFDRSAPCGPIVTAQETGDVLSGGLQLTVNGEVRQRTFFALMIWQVPEILSRLSRDYRLQPGDLVFTGTPAGVAAIRPGDRVELTIDGLPQLTITITQEEVS